MARAKKVEEVKATEVVEAVEVVEKAPAKKAAAKKETKTTGKTCGRKAAAKKEAAVVEEAAVVKAEEVTVSMTLQFAEKSYTEESLLNIAKDVWKYDLNQEEAALKTVELYVKPEEGLCYYVCNGDVTGSFVI